MNAPTHKWTNASVQRFAGNEDPIVKMETAARALALQAMDKGWRGPPFDPALLGELLGFEIEARADVPEARVLHQDNGKFKIEFNPTRPQGRIYFSIAHEIAHTLFPDCKQRVRHRGLHDAMSDDDWQIEVLCNVGAAELLMPVGSFVSLRKPKVSVEDLLDERKGFQVSTEAILIRYAKLAPVPCAAFCASQILSGRGAGRYRVDYIIPSSFWSRPGLVGRLFSADSSIAECTAIGFTAKGQEKTLDEIPLRVEAVGLPPYPGQIAPRVAGLLFESGHHRAAASSIVYLRGNAIAPRGAGKKVVAHIVNDRTANWGGGGFAVAVRNTWPDIQREFAERVKETRRDLLQLGQSVALKATDDITVFNMVAQHGYGPSDTPRIRYAALETCLEKLAAYARTTERTVHMPRIGTKNAGGSWQVIEGMIERILVRDGISVTVYDLPN